ncbi:MAG: hypothetical protein BRD23_04780 [Halobacteriales archaeon SW_9_67_25]|jgi:TRAP-type C4-dicarboxylate transport system permease small subunit|nr:MAG: hypothetical protein BRD23_04780 [Halobacteriales archaeon SW_9_67_25]
MGAVDHSMDRLATLCYGIGALALGAVTVLMMVRIVSRNLGLELAGLQLYAQFFGVWMVFIVTGALGWEGHHIEIEYFSDRFPDRVKSYHAIVVGLVNIAMCALIVAGALLAMREFWAGTSPSVNIPLPLYYVPMIVGVTILAVVYGSRIANQVTAIRNRREG